MESTETINVKTLFSEEELQKGIKDLGTKLSKFYKDEEVYVICVMRGGVFFAVELAKHLTVPVKMEFVKLSSYGSGTTSSGKVNADNVSLPDLNGKNVLVADDIVDSGLTAKYFLDFLKENYQTKTLKFCSLLNKKARRQVDINPDFYVFDVDDKFIVGYGLDYKEHYRNLPYIGYVEN